jgi:hypothetical protein
MARAARAARRFPIWRRRSSASPARPSSQGPEASIPSRDPRHYYPADIRGGFHGRNYRFMQRYRSGFDDNLGSEFDAAFCRLEYLRRDRFDVSWHRHTGQWFCLYRERTLAEALELIERDGHLHPL